MPIKQEQKILTAAAVTTNSKKKTFQFRFYFILFFHICYQSHSIDAIVVVIVDDAAEVAKRG